MNKRETKDLFISSALSKPTTDWSNTSEALAAQLNACHTIEDVGSDDGGFCGYEDCDNCILGEDNIEAFKDWSKPDNISVACCGCVHTLTTLCEHCLRGNTLKDFYETETL